MSQLDMIEIVAWAEESVQIWNMKYEYKGQVKTRKMIRSFIHMSQLETIDIKATTEEKV